MFTDFLVWLVCFFVQGALIGMVMYALILLSDLENDFMNPHDASAGINRWVVPEFVAQSSFAALLILRFEWIAFPLHTALALWNARQYLKKRHKTDVTEIFRQLPREKNMRIAKLAFYLISFIYCIFRVVDTAVNGLMSPEARHTAHQLFQDAAASF
ncbi:hypothetical protein WJX73_006585 [Symbiochloris irregularis]|uniref:Cornichon n=1 Tax=Symbiochloris irregularis TaxID=706552 RepID=A0AAW1PEF8_9CHLO